VLKVQNNYHETFKDENMKTMIFTLLISMALTASAQVTVDWANYPGGVSLATDASDNVYTANWEFNPGGDITLTKRDADGTIIWEVPYNNTDPTRHEVATWVETDGSGNILVSGTIRSGISNPVNVNALLMKYDPSGNLLWRKLYESDFDGSSTKKCLVDAQDNVYVLGLGNSGTGVVTKIKKFSPGGTVLWTWYDNSGIGAPSNFKFTPDYALVITGRSFFGSINGFAKIDLDGNFIWSHTGVNSLTAGDAAGDGFGYTYLVNGIYGGTNTGSIVKKITPSGAVAWEQTNTMGGMRVEVGSDNKPVVCGYPASGIVGAAFMKYGQDGTTLWQNLDADGAGYALLSHAQMKLDGSGAAYLAAGTMSQIAVCKVNSDGSTAWTISAPSGYASGLDFGSDNSVYVVGGTTARILQSPSVGLPEKQSSAFSVYPNPVRDRFTVTFSNETPGTVSLELLNAQGGKVQNLMMENMPSGEFCRGFMMEKPAGMYILRMTAGIKESLTKIIIQ
jgi:hypothetical protein